MRRLLVVVLAGALVMGMTAPVGAADHLGDPAKVAICHFESHDATGPFGSLGFTGDYVIVYQEDVGPTADWCEGTGEPSILDYGVEPGNMIIVSVKALKGHEVEGMERLAAYPDGWKG